MNAAALLVEAAKQGVILFCEDGQLGFELTGDTFPAALKEKVLVQREAIIEYLTQLKTSAEARPREESAVAELGAALSRAMSSLDKAFETPELKYDSRVAIQPGMREGEVILCFPGAGASVTTFVDLANALGEHWPMHGVQPRGTDGLLPPHATVEAAAEHHLPWVASMAAQRAVHLIGHSFGAWIAFETANRLRATGRRAASLTLIDSSSPDLQGSPRREYTAVEVLRRFIRAVEQHAEVSLGVDPHFDELDYDKQLLLLRDSMIRAGLIAHRSSIESLCGPLRVFGAALRTRYEPRQRCDEPVRLIVARDAHFDELAMRREHDALVSRWRHWAPNIIRWTGPGDHMTILKPPHVNDLANWWSSLTGCKGLRGHAATGRGPRTSLSCE